MARDYLAIIATTAPIERLFSIASNIANPRHRNRLTKARINQIICLRSWKKLPIIMDDEDDSDNSDEDFDNPEKSTVELLE